MISCITPSSMFIDETLLTLNYASRAMNIKNQPVLSFSRRTGGRPGDLEREIDELRKENFDLREQLNRAVR